jgi:hypothetical protein
MRQNFVNTLGKKYLEFSAAVDHCVIFDSYDIFGLVEMIFLNAPFWFTT